MRLREIVRRADHGPEFSHDFYQKDRDDTPKPHSDFYHDLPREDGEPESPLTSYNQGSGVLLLHNGLALLVRPSTGSQAGLWGVPGGLLPEQGTARLRAWQNAKDACCRCLGSLPPGFGRARARHIVVNEKTSKHFTTFLVELPYSILPWRPQLGKGYDAFAWVDRQKASTLRLNPDVKKLLNNYDLWGTDGTSGIHETEELRLPYNNAVQDEDNNTTRPQDIDQNPYNPRGPNL